MVRLFKLSRHDKSITDALQDMVISFEEKNEKLKNYQRHEVKEVEEEELPLLLS